MSATRTVLVLLTISVSACATGSGPDDPDDAVATADPGDQARALAAGPGFKQCLRSFTPSPHSSWRHTGSRFVSALGSNVHSANDVVVRPGATARLEAKLAYGGVLSKDLEDEWVWVFVHDCTAWRYVGYALTNDDGRAVFNLIAPAAPGVYDARIEVVGDATYLPLRLWVTPNATHTATFDIDGTLTTSDSELVEEILLGHQPDAYPGAVDVAWAEAARGEIVVYLTARPEILAGKTRAWLSALGFPPGIVRMTHTAGEALPSNSGVGTFKANFLLGLRAGGMLLDDAFGNATTDVYAYARAAIPVSRTWIIGSNAGSGGTIPVTGSWAAVADRLNGEPSVTQPW